MKITQEQVRAFEQLSHDHNPLHTDAGYARSTQFGRPVVYGMCGVLLGLAAWAKGRCFRLLSLKGQFGKPLFENDDYELRITEDGSHVKVQYLKGPVVQTGFAFSWEAGCAERNSGGSADDAVDFEPLPEALDPEIGTALAGWRSREFLYSMNRASVAESLQRLGLGAGQMPISQLNALVGSSYLVGMELPGRQALYSGFEFEFDDVAADEASGAFRLFSVVTAKHDERLNRIAITGRGPGVRSFALVAFQRPRPVRYELSEIRAVIGQSAVLANKAVFISGATRGFGSVLAKMFALKGAKLMANYRGNREEAEAMASELSGCSSQVSLHGGDVSVPVDCQRLRDEIEKGAGRIDILVSNAFPRIEARSFLEQDSREFIGFVEKSLAATVTLFRELMPLVPKGGMVVLISSVFTESPKPQFSHYVAAKSALEGLLRVLALEFRDRQFVIVRAPRMLTDQTNLPFDLSRPLSPIEIGRRLLDAISSVRGPGNLHEINLSEEHPTPGLKAA